MHILIADDAATIRNLLRDILVQAGFQKFTFAVDGAEALNALNVPGIDLALLDWHMPRLSGYDVLSAVRKKGCKTPIVMVTGESSPASVRCALEAGIDQYVVKPFRPELLIEKVYRALTVKDPAPGHASRAEGIKFFESTPLTASDGGLSRANELRRRPSYHPALPGA